MRASSTRIVVLFLVLLTIAGCTSSVDGTAVIRKPTSPTGVDYRDYLSGDSLARFQQLDRYRAVDNCNYLDPDAVIRSFATPLYAGPQDGDLGTLSDCDVEVDPTKNPNKVGSVSVSTDGTLTSNDTPDGEIGAVPYYGGAFDTICGYGVVAPTGQYIEIMESLSGLTLAKEVNMDAVCKNTMALLVASLPRIMGTEPITSTLPHARTVATRVDPCVALNAVLYDHPLATTQMQFPNPPRWTTRCSIGLDGAPSERNLQSVQFTLIAAGSTYTGTTETTILGKPAFRTADGCGLVVVVGQGRPTITKTSYRAIRLALDPSTMGIDNRPTKTEELVDTLQVTSSDCALTTSMATAVTAKYLATK